jgi:hypothetical protein
MLERRPPQESDQCECEKAYNILQEAMLANPQIEQTLWFSAHMSCFANGCINSGLSYAEFCIIISDGVRAYKNWWEDGR